MTEITVDQLRTIRAPGLRRAPASEGTLLAGPFSINHNGSWTVGWYLEDAGELLTLIEGPHLRELPSTSQITYEASEQKVTIIDEEFESRYELTPLTTADADRFHPDLMFSGVDEYSEFVTRMALSDVRGVNYPLTPYFLNVANDGVSVTGLYNDDGNIFRRDHGEWVFIDGSPDSVVELHEKVLVLHGALELFDTHEDDDSILLDQFRGYILQ